MPQQAEESNSLKLPPGLLQMLNEGSWSKKLIALLTISIMITCGMVNAGFIILALTGEDGFSGWANLITWETVVGAAGGIFSGYAQKNIYLESLDDFENMCRDGILNKITGNKIYLFGLAVICAICSFLVNYGMAQLGIGVLLGSSTPILLPFLAVLFALANAILVFYTAIDALKKGQTLPECFRSSKMLGVILSILFTLTAAWGLVMTFYPGISEVIGERFQNLEGKIAFGVILGLALLTEVYYSFTKACYLSYMLISRNFPSFLTLIANLINAIIAAPPGFDGGLKFTEDNLAHENNVMMQSVGAGTAATWSMACSVQNAPGKKGIIINQFKRFQETAKPKTNEYCCWPSLKFA